MISKIIGRAYMLTEKNMFVASLVKIFSVVWMLELAMDIIRHNSEIRIGSFYIPLSWV